MKRIPASCALLLVALWPMQVSASAWYTARRSCSIFARFKAHADVGRYNSVGQRVTGPYSDDHGCTYAGGWNYNYYEKGVLKGYAKAYASAGSSYSSSNTYGGSTYFPSGVLSTNFGGYYLSAGYYSMAAGSYFRNYEPIVDSIGVSRASISTSSIDLSPGGAPNSRGFIDFNDLALSLSAEQANRYGGFARIIVWSPPDTFNDTPVTASRVLWEASVRLEDGGKFVTTGGFHPSQFSYAAGPDTVADSTGHAIAVFAADRYQLIPHTLSLDIENDIVAPLLANNPRGVPSDVIQNANYTNLEVRVISASGFGSFVDDLGVPVPMTSGSTLIGLSIALLGAAVVALRRRISGQLGT